MVTLSRTWISRAIIITWLCNCLLGSIIAIKQVWIPYMNAGSDSYSKIISDPFNGTTMPIAYIPDWTKVSNQDKAKRFEDLPISEYLPIPLYDPITLINAGNTSKSDLILRYTYITQYMGNYKLDYKEFAGSHLAEDIRAPIGTPVLSVANGVVIRTVESDAVGTKFIVIRHDNVPINGVNTTIYSCYLHLSEINIPEGTKVKKGDMIGRVGMTGMATTPHLHFQIDTSDAPFHPYWPYTSTEARAAGVDFYTAINIGLGKEKAVQYTINPMAFVNMYLGGNTSTEEIVYSSAPSTPVNPTVPNNTNTTSTTPPAGVNTTIASYVGRSSEETCQSWHFSDVPEKSTLGNMLYPLMGKKCLFQEMSVHFDPKKSVTNREAIINIMKFYDIKPNSGTSHFLDIPIGDNFQGYALVAYRKWILSGNYASPDKILTKEEFIELLVKIGRPDKNPWQMQIYTDVSPMNPKFQTLQDYGFLVRARWGKLYPNTLLTRSLMAQIFNGITQKK